MQRALLSVSDKSGLIPFAQGLVEAGVELLSTGGTARRSARTQKLDASLYEALSKRNQSRLIGHTQQGTLHTASPPSASAG